MPRGPWGKIIVSDIWSREGKPIGRPVVVDMIDADLVLQLRQEGKSWSQVAEAHPRVKSSSGKRIKPSVGSIRRVFERQVAR